MPANFLSNHFADTRRRTTPRQIERERFVLPGVPFKRWMLMPAAALIQMSVGSFYAWSVYNAPVAAALNEGRPPLPPGAPHAPGYVTKEQLAEVFYTAVAFFGIAACLSGPWLERHGPKFMSLVGASLFFAGHMLSAVGVHVRVAELLFLGYGVCGGLGIGISYLVPVATLQQWYPDKKGFASGVGVGSFGAGSVIASFSQSALLSLLGPKLTFLTLGCVYFTLHAACSFMLRFPPPDYEVGRNAVSRLQVPAQPPKDAKDAINAPAPNGPLTSGMTAEAMGGGGGATAGPSLGVAGSAHQEAAGHDAHDELVADPLAKLHHGDHDDLAHPHVHPESVPLHKATFVEELQSADFRWVYAILLLASIPGLVIVSRAADMIVSAFRQPVPTSVWIVGVNGLSNVLGRFVAGVLSDKVPRLMLMAMFLIATIVVLVTMYVSLSGDIFPLFVFSMWTLTACYGAACALVPAILGEVFGSGHIGALYGVALTGWAAGGVLGGVGFTALINSQRDSGVPAQHIYDICIYSMIPMAAIGVAVVGLFAMRRRRATRDVKHPIAAPGQQPAGMAGAEAGRAVGAIEMHRVHTDKSVSSITGGRYPVHAHSVFKHPPAHP